MGGMWSKRIYHFLFLTLICTVMLAPGSCATFRGDDVVSGPFLVTHREDFNGDGRPEDFVLEWSVVQDYSFDPDTMKKSREKFKWYQARLQIATTAGAIMADDLFAIKADDFWTNLGQYTGMPGLTPEKYFANYFDAKYPATEFHSFSRRWVKLKEENIDRAMIKELIRYYHSGATLEDIETELLADRRLVFEYVRSDRADSAVITYSRNLGRAVYLANKR